MIVHLEMQAEAGLPELEVLLTEDSKNRHKWLIDRTPITDHYSFPGGMVAFSLFKAARYCFIYGHYLASVVLGLAYIENTLYGLFIDSERAGSLEKGLLILSRKALIAGIIDDNTFDIIDRSRALRNTFPPFNNGKKSLNNDLNHNKNFKVLEKDAKQLMDTMIHLLKIHPVSG